MAARRHLTFDFEIKKKSGRDITIAGLSNANTVDRGQERIEPKGWLLKNYDKNPVYLFDHGHDPAFGFLPIGKSTKHVPTDDGLYTEGRISNSTTEKITAVRDLVEEGILKTFSVGFDPKQDTKDGDVLVITQAELIEQSVVPIPMNQDSVFSVMQKRLGKAACPSARRWFENWAKKAKLIEKKAFPAALFHQTVVDRSLNLGEVVEAIAKKSATKERLVREMFEGDRDFPQEVLNAAAGLLKVSPKLLLESKDASLLERARLKEEVKDVKKKPKKKAAAASSKKGAEFVCTMVSVPKDAIDEAEAAASFIEQHGYAADKMSETESHWLFEQAPKDGLNSEAMQTFDLGDGVMAEVCPKADGGKADPNADDEAMNADEGKTEGADGEQENPDGEKPTDQNKPKTGEDGDGEEKEADKKAAADTTPPPDQNPLIELQKQQVTMLGAIAEALKGIGAKLDELIQKEDAEPSDQGGDSGENPPPAKTGAGSASDADDAEKALVLQIRKARDEMKVGLKRLGV